jgi:single-strand DNA-binding protein
VNEIWTTVVGNLASDVTRRRTTDGTELSSFRVASNVRRFDRDAGDWLTAGTSFVTVTAWRRLGQNVAASFVKGDPVIVHGRLSTREYMTKDGLPRTDVEIDATAVGPDLSRCTAVLSRTTARATSVGAEETHEPDLDQAEDVAVGRDGSELGADTEPDDNDDPWRATELAAAG